MHKIKIVFNFVKELNTFYVIMLKKIIPNTCPSCGGKLNVQSLHCSDCDTTITGDYQLPVLLKLKDDKLRFVTEFIKCSGSLKEMASSMSLSYPTVRNILDDIIHEIKTLENNG